MAENNVSPGNFAGKMKPGYIWGALVIIIVAIAIITGIYVVDQTEEAVVMRFGRYYKTEGPGLHYKLPLGVDVVEKVPTKVIQTMQFGFRTDQPGITTIYSSGDFSSESIMLTGDLNIVDVEWIIQYRISDPRAWLFNVSNREKTIRDISQSVINQLVGDRAILNVISSERPNIENLAVQMIEENLNQYKLGIDITTVKLQNIVPPEGEVQDAFEDVNKAIQDMNRLINEGKEAYNAEIPKAKGQANQMLEVAEGYATERVNRARGDVARFSAVREEYEKNPQVTRDRLYLEMMEDVFTSGEGLDLVDKNLENFLPLKNITEGGQQ